MELTITNDPRISAIYYALLQCGYDFYSIGRDVPAVSRLQGFIQPDPCEYGFFSEVRQSTCTVYPYWPRAAMLETAAYFIDLPHKRFADLGAYKQVIQVAENISGRERGPDFWDWVPRFPAALSRVLESRGFQRFLNWENGWTAEQNRRHKNDLKRIAELLALCKERFNSPFQRIEIVLDPIKCVNSSDYHRRDGAFIFCSGALRADSVIHEFIHHAVHPVVERRRGEILRRGLETPGLDASYSLDGGEAGALNAFEEYMVRRLTDRIVNGAVPADLETFFDREMAGLERPGHP